MEEEWPTMSGSLKISELFRAAGWFCFLSISFRSSSLFRLLVLIFGEAVFSSSEEEDELLDESDSSVSLPPGSEFL